MLSVWIKLKLFSSENYLFCFFAGMNPCQQNNGGCKELCFYLGNSEVRCACSYGKLYTDNRSCVGKLELLGNISILYGFQDSITKFLFICQFRYLSFGFLLCYSFHLFKELRFPNSYIKVDFGEY